MDSQTLPRLPFLCRLRSLRRSVSVASAVPHSRSARESTISGLRPWVPRTALFCALITWSVLAQEKPSGPTESPRGLAGLDLTALMNIEVTSVSGRPERLSDAAGSIFVITGDEIRRSGATNLPEALRLLRSPRTRRGAASFQPAAATARRSLRCATAAKPVRTATTAFTASTSTAVIAGELQARPFPR